MIPGMHFSQAPTLHTERLMLRPVVREDAPAHYIMRSDAGLNRYTGVKPCPSVEAAAGHLKMLIQDAVEHTALAMTVVDRQSGETAGEICYWNLSEDGLAAELGYVFLPGFHGRGIAYEAVKGFLELGFSGFGFKMIFADPSPENTASVRLLKKLGFTGGAMCDTPGREDLCHYELTRGGA